MINFRKDLFVKLCKNTVIVPKAKKVAKFDMKKLRDLYMNILEAESNYSYIKATDGLSEERLGRINNKIKSLKKTIITLERETN
jgi:hypothetical protein